MIFASATLRQKSSCLTSLSWLLQCSAIFWHTFVQVSAKPCRDCPNLARFHRSLPLVCQSSPVLLEFFRIQQTLQNLANSHQQTSNIKQTRQRPSNICKIEQRSATAVPQNTCVAGVLALSCQSGVGGDFRPVPVVPLWSPVVVTRRGRLLWLPVVTRCGHPLWSCDVS